MLKLVDSTSYIKEVIITPAMYQSAKITSEQYAHKLKNSIRNGKGTLVGCLGEEMVLSLWPDIQRLNTFQFDCIHNGKRLEIKTKERTVPPSLSYDCSVNRLNGVQDADYYIFTSVLNTYDRGWVIGYIKTDSFWKEAKFYQKGSVDASNGFTFHCDTYNMPYSNLRRFK